jgi:hypothetical protein
VRIGPGLHREVVGAAQRTVTGRPYMPCAGLRPGVLVHNVSIMEVDERWGRADVAR